EQRPGGGLDFDLSALRWLLLTGEEMRPHLCRQWFRSYAHVRLMNAYGPTECSDDVTHFSICEAPSADLTTTPIGRPIPNTRLYVVDANMQLVPIGIPGELCVGGIAVGRGYLNDASRTTAAFGTDPFAADPGGRLYHTGDLVRYRADGNLE